ncbi:MAG: hypothetical protein AABZ17_03565 [Nitrospirota bacterium]
MDTPNLSPREFLKARRPERFSDSVIEKTSALDRSMLEYHLESLTNRIQETDFQQFAQHLAEREMCPNLLPQTGPTGGGDSKIDKLNTINGLRKMLVMAHWLSICMP